MPRIHILNCDGTRNGRDDEFPTNIRLFHKALVDIDGQLPYYFEGPGNDESNFIQKFIGGGFGLGCKSIRDMAYNSVAATYQFGDIILGTGFSRGGLVIRTVFDKISKEGINGFEPELHLICLDTVCSEFPFGKYQQEPLFGDLHISPKVKNAFHILSSGENRKAFRPVLMNGRDGVEEVWIEGDFNHSDIGGGYEYHGIADRTLRMMAEKATEFVGLTFNPFPAQQELNEPHYEEGFLRREKRRIGVKVDDQWSDIEPKIIRLS